MQVSPLKGGLIAPVARCPLGWPVTVTAPWRFQTGDDPWWEAIPSRLGFAAIGATATGEVSSLGGAEVEVEASAGAGRGDVSHAAGVQQMP